MFQPVYTSSELYAVPANNGRRGFFPASHKPRYVVGLRVFVKAELAAGPNGGSPDTTVNEASFITLVEASTLQPWCKALPAARCSNAFIANLSKGANPFNTHGTGPVVVPFQPRTLTDLGASWVKCNKGEGFLFVEVFYNDAWHK